MDTFKNKTYFNFDYPSRYTSTPYYYDTKHDKEVYGVGSLMDTSINYYSYTVKAGDTLDSIALKFYSNPTYWWILAYFNHIIDALKPLKENEIIKVPNMSSISFGANR